MTKEYVFIENLLINLLIIVALMFWSIFFGRYFQYITMRDKLRFLKRQIKRLEEGGKN